MASFNKNILLDTNVILNGIFIPGSYSGKVLQYSKEGKISGYISNTTMEEAKRILRLLSRDLLFDAFQMFISSLRKNNITTLEEDDSRSYARFSKIKGKGDQSICADAFKNNFFICTNDEDDFVAATQYGVEVFSPKNICYWLSPLDGGYISHGDFATPKEGTIFLYASTNWAYLKSMDDDQTIIDLEGIGILYYSSQSRSFALSFDNGPTINIDIPPTKEKEEQFKFVISYKCTEGTTVYINDINTSTNDNTKWMPLDMKRGGVRFFNGRRGGLQLVAKIHMECGYQNRLTKKAVKRRLTGKITPNPIEYLDFKNFIHNKDKILRSIMAHLPLGLNIENDIQSKS